MARPPRLLAFASTAALAFSCGLSAQAEPLPDPLAVSPAMKAMVGKRYWVSDPATPAGIELCPSATGRFKECRRLVNATFTVEGTVAPGVTFAFFRVKLDSGERGFISGLYEGRFHPADLDDGTRATIARCEREGPAIGMNATDVRGCWGTPNRINTTKTADGTDEQWVYRGPKAYVYLRDGVVTAIQISR